MTHSKNLVSTIRLLILSKPYGHRFVDVFKNCTSEQTDFEQEIITLSGMHCGSGFAALVDEFLEEHNHVGCEDPILSTEVIEPLPSISNTPPLLSKIKSKFKF
jgi:hypothetical protein|tara:strand:+ start:1081 stop:1389 length:309 start_codon:yes stop_codon:yes gene_type:complete